MSFYLFYFFILSKKYFKKIIFFFYFFYKTLEVLLKLVKSLNIILYKNFFDFLLLY